ncbi:MAG: response regulator, partial [Proteobacteria bacterium]|nr:response regulator [Pseudomonadota bacterium]
MTIFNTSNSSSKKRKEFPINQILVIDDEVPILNMLKLMLTRIGFLVDTAESGEEGIKKINSNKYALILTDIKMSELNGIEVLKQVKEIDKNIEVIILTAYGTIDSAIEAIKLGAFHYITKPFQTDVLLITISRSL